MENVTPVVEFFSATACLVIFVGFIGAFVAIAIRIVADADRTITISVPIDPSKIAKVSSDDGREDINRLYDQASHLWPSISESGSLEIMLSKKSDDLTLLRSFAKKYNKLVGSERVVVKEHRKNDSLMEFFV